MVYEFTQLERHSMNKLISQLTLEQKEYVQFQAEDNTVFIINPNRVQKFLVKLYKYLDIILFSLILYLLYTALGTTDMGYIVFIEVIYIIIAMFYKFSDKIIINMLKNVDK
jgi:hypothetical protein